MHECLVEVEDERLPADVLLRLRPDQPLLVTVHLRSRLLLLLQQEHALHLLERGSLILWHLADEGLGTRGRRATVVILLLCLLHFCFLLVVRSRLSVISVLVSSQVHLLIGCRWKRRLLLQRILLASLPGVIGCTAGFLRLDATIRRSVVLILLELRLLVRVLYRYYLLSIIVLECVAVDSGDLLGLHALALPLGHVHSAATVASHCSLRACHLHLLRSASCSSLG